MFARKKIIPHGRRMLGKPMGEPLPLYGQYGINMQDRSVTASLRGSGEWNPPPWNPRKDRGPAGSRTMEVAINEGAWDNPYKAQQEAWNKKYEPEYSKPVGDYEQLLDQWKILPYSVGDTGLHVQPPQSWDQPNGFGLADNYTMFGLRSTQLEPNPLLNFFFNKHNVDYLHKRIQDEVYRIKKVRISRQSNDELLIIMNNYYTKALSGFLPNTASGNIMRPSPRGPKACSLEERVSRLNKAVIEEAVKQILSGIDQYLQYYKDASSLPVPLTHPVYTSMKGSRVLSERVGIHDNPHEFTKAINSYNERYNII